MSRIRVEKEPESISKEFGATVEACCFCREPTKYWVAPVTGDSVACCRKCSQRWSRADLPTKREWMARKS